MRTIWLLVFLGLMAVQPAMADELQPASAVEQPDFSPPPVPEFMLRKPEKPLTLEEMKKQADEASRRARAEKAELPGKESKPEEK